MLVLVTAVTGRLQDPFMFSNLTALCACNSKACAVMSPASNHADTMHIHIKCMPCKIFQRNCTALTGKEEQLTLLCRLETCTHLSVGPQLVPRTLNINIKNMKNKHTHAQQKNFDLLLTC